MPRKVEIPPLGESVTEAVLLRWIRNEGEHVSTDDPVCELETDKANVELPAPASGVLKHVKKQGDTVRIGEVVAEIDEAGKAAAAPAPAKAAAPEASKEVPKAAPKAQPPTPVAEPKSENVEGLSPSVRRAVREHQVDPTNLQGSGPRGRILKEDVVAAASGGKAPTATKASAAESSVARTEKVVSGSTALVPGVRRVPMTKIRKKIAERLVQAQHQAAMLTTFNEIDMSAVLSLREKYKAKFQEQHGVSLGFLSFFARASALALAEFPSVNASIDGEDILFHDAVHLGIAVSTERGLVVPVLRNIGEMSFGKIESEIKRMAGAARDGKLALPELGGGTFTITNGGVFGSLMSTPILNSPQSGILGLHAIQKRPVAIDDKVEIRPMMYVALSYDHRLVDGKDSVSFLVRVKQLIEDPTRLMLQV